MITLMRTSIMTKMMNMVLRKEMKVAPFLLTPWCSSSYLIPTSSKTCSRAWSKIPWCQPSSTQISSGCSWTRTKGATYPTWSLGYKGLPCSGTSWCNSPNQWCHSRCMGDKYRISNSWLIRLKYKEGSNHPWISSNRIRSRWLNIKLRKSMTQRLRI